MRYRDLLILLGLVMIALGLIGRGWLLIAVWLGANFVVLGIAHGRKAPGVFGKRKDGTLPWWSWLLFLPMHCLTMSVWHLARTFSREPACNEVTAMLVVGRRLLDPEQKEEFDNYVDLTAEFTEPCLARRPGAYVCFPILDAGAPDPMALKQVVAGLRPGRTFVHCAQGHGRTGLFALALLLNSGAAASAKEGLALLVAARPGIRLNKQQLDCIHIYAQSLKATH